ncbi:MAG: O-antigen ligase family protein, partial [Candidatus Hydrogenedentes bacterium]|nr:O-antigen ligase family protein [Candidatus Hydrogenedentota bacterium]
MASQEADNSKEPGRVLSRAQILGAGAAIAVSCVLAALLTAITDLSPLQTVGLPLALAAAWLIYWNSHWALCFAAFAITPFGIVQQEIFSVTVNLPEVIVLALVVKEGVRVLRGKERPADIVPWKALAFFALCLGIAVGTGLTHGNGLIKVLQDFRQFVEFVVLFGLIVQRTPTQAQTIHIGMAYVLGATLIAIHGIVQHFIPVGISEVQIASDLVLHNGVRSSSFYGATPLGALMVLAVGPAIGMLFVVKQRRTRALLLTCIGLCLLAMLFTKTRGSWVGMAVALSFFFLWVRPNKKMTLALFAATTILALAVGPMILSRLSTLGDPEEDRSLMERTQYYVTAAHIARAHPLIGLGWGCYYDIEEIIQAEHYVKTPRPENAEDATVHSAYLQIFVKTGAIGLLGFLVILGVWGERLWRVYKTRPHPRRELALFAGLAAGLTGYLFHSTFENFFQWPVMAQSFWLLLGLSFVRASSLGGKRAYPKIPAVLIGACVLAFILFMAACLRLEKSHTDHYAVNVETALENGNLKRALRLAKRAATVRIGDPMVNVVYARALLLDGNMAEALTQLELSVGIDYPEGRPRRIRTGPRHYFAPARLLRGQLYAEEGSTREAVSQFELARAYADLSDPGFAPFHKVMYENYAAAGIWARALEFATPDETALDALDKYSLARLAYFGEGLGAWDLVAHAASRLLSHAAYRSDAYYLLGRMRLALGQPGAATIHLGQAARDGHPNAPYYLGLARVALEKPEEAVAAFVSSPPGDLTYPLALAHALLLRRTLGSDALPTAAEIGQKLAQALAEMTTLESLGSSPLALTAFYRGTVHAHGKPTRSFPRTRESRTRQEALNSPLDPRVRGDDGLLSHSDSERFPSVLHDGPRPLALLWGGAPGNLNEITLVPGAVSDPPSYQLGDTGSLLQLQWAENRLLSPTLLESATKAGPLPGWIDGAHDWFDLRPNYTATRMDMSTGEVGLDIPGLAWFYSVPTSSSSDRVFLLTGALRALTRSARLEWQTLGPDSNVHESRVLLQGREGADTAHSAACIQPHESDDSIRIYLEVARNGRAQFTAISLPAITP